VIHRISAKGGGKLHEEADFFVDMDGIARGKLSGRGCLVVHLGVEATASILHP
jgi:hypothetical protein